jgi:LysM repeat protein
MSIRNKKFELSPRLRLGVGRGYSQNQILKFSAIFCLILAVALTSYSINLVFTELSQNQSTPQVLGATDVKDPKPTATLEFKSYTVQKGDTLFNISQKFNIDWSTLAMLNSLKSPFILKPGQTINIPK